MATTPNILAGIAYPFIEGPTGLPMAAVGTDVVRYALVVLLRTPKGSRVMRPTLGTNLQKLIFENQGPLMQSLVKREILVSVSSFLPQVKIQALDFTQDNTLIQVNIRYIIQGVVDQTGPVTIGQTG